MTRVAAALALGFLLAACNANSSPGADREAQVEPPARAAAIKSAGAALAGIATGAIQPEFMTDADIEALGGLAGKCAFRMTSVAYPAFVYEPGRTGMLKLNGTLIPLRASRAGSYGDDGLVVVLRPVDGEGHSGLPEQEMIVMLPGAKDELGYRGYRQCLRTG